MTRRLGVAVMAVLLALYLAFVGVLAVRLIGTGEAAGVALGVALLVMPLLGVWGLVLELRFGFASTRLERMLEAEGPLPLDGLPVLPSGRVDREAAALLFEGARAEVEDSPEAWQGWLRLGLVYDGAGDRRRAREAVRTAIRLERSERAGHQGR